MYAFEKKHEGIKFVARGCETAKVKILVRGPGKFQQREGDPPAPDDAPPPKPVLENKGKGTGKGGRVSPGLLALPAWQPRQGNMSSGWQPANGRPLTYPLVSARPWPAKDVTQSQPWNWSNNSWKSGNQSTWKPANPVQLKPAPQAKITQTAQGQASQVLRGNATRGSAAAAQADRSRTPPPKKDTVLPFPWEEHWSDEYGIPYFWNSKTGESIWERPTK